MTIFQVVYYNQFGERVADFGFYEDKIDAEERAFEVRIKAPTKSGKVCIEDVFVHDDSQKKEKETKTEKHSEKKCLDAYTLKLND